MFAHLTEQLQNKLHITQGFTVFIFFSFYSSSLAYVGLRVISFISFVALSIYIPFLYSINEKKHKVLLMTEDSLYLAEEYLRL